MPLGSTPSVKSRIETAAALAPRTEGVSTMLSAQREWTVLLYTMADDTSLRACANETLLDIHRAATNSAVKTVAQVTLRSNLRHPIRRFDFEPAASPAHRIDVKTGLAYMQCPDEGPRHNLTDFLRWGQQTYPAKRYCVVLQGHAWGADYDIPSLNHDLRHRAQPWHDHYRLILGSPQSKDHLTNKDLEQVLTHAAQPGKFHVLGMDSCLMSMAEILCELSGCAVYTVAPEGLGPVRGWPFYPILTRLNLQPEMGPAALGTVILDAYARQYRSWGEGVKLTISLCELAHAEELMRAMEALVQGLRAGLRSHPVLASIIRARRQCAFFRIPTYVDLYQFCALLRRQRAVGRSSALHLACRAVQTALRGRFVQKVALRRGSNDGHGLSIYFPHWRIGGHPRPSPWKRTPWPNPMATPANYDEAVIKVNAAYLNHEFADRCGWKEFLLEFLRARLVI